MSRKLPFTREQIEAIAKEYPTPFHLYDEVAIRANAQLLNSAFGWAPGFQEFYAVKACPNNWILDILRQEGFGADCSSLPELLLAEKTQMVGEQIMFTSNNTPAKEFVAARAMGAIINLDDITHIEYLRKHAGLPSVICLRYNPGPLRGGNAILGKPEEAKYGFTKPQLFEGYSLLQSYGVQRFGLHTMIASNELNPQYFVDTAQMLLDLVVEFRDELGITMEFINIGGGIGIPYKPDDKPVDLQYISDGIRQAYDQTKQIYGITLPKLFMENGRMITGPYGYLVTEAIHHKDIYNKHYIGVDACMVNLMRPALYGAYHEITVLGKEDWSYDRIYDVTGSLCENNDKFAIDRYLPRIEEGDFVVVHNAGAHGHSMGSNYNGKFRSAELLLKANGTVQLIRKAETIENYFATLIF